MALKDLASDLSNFKYDQSSPDKVDNQINNGVDFFDDTKGGAVGFRPKTDLKSLYNKVQEGTVVAPNAGVRTNTKTRSAYGQMGEYGEEENTGLSNPSHVLSGDNILGKRIQPFTLSDFMTTPLADYTSGYTPPDNLSETFGLASADLQIPDFSLWFTFSTIGGGVTQFASLLPIVDRTSQFSTPEQDGANNIGLVPEGLINQITLNLPVESGTDIFQDTFSPQALINAENLSIINLYHKYENNDFTNTPGGLTPNNLFPNTSLGQGLSFRASANTGPHSGNDSHPFILRPFSSNQSNQSNWKSYTTDVDTSNEGISIAGVNLNLLAQRNKADKDRIDAFLDTPQGVNFVAKQESLQKMNPTIESKFFNISSVYGVANNGVPNFHPERHSDPTGRLARYETILPLTGLNTEEGVQLRGGSRLAYQAKAFTVNIPDIKIPTFESRTLRTLTVIALGLINTLADSVAAGLFIGLSNPNKYLNPFGSASPTSMGILGSNPSFDSGLVSGAFKASLDAYTALNKKGGTFNKDTSIKDNGSLIKRHSTLAYSSLTTEASYLSGKSPSELNRFQTGGQIDIDEYNLFQRSINRNVTNQVGNQGQVPYTKDSKVYELDGKLPSAIKGSLNSDNVDKVNALKYPLDYSEAPVKEVKDFIKFKFKDVVNNRFIIFRAILDGITDSIGADYGEERYIGRPDKVYVYQGANRDVSFNFAIYPKTKQEFPILMDKLNYLIGMCYPSYTEQDMMVTPFMELTLGDMFNGTPGLLMGVSVTVEDNSTWELDEGLQFPHYIKVACEFKHIGKNKLASTGIHYDLPKIYKFAPNDPDLKKAAIIRFEEPNDELTAGMIDPNTGKNLNRVPYTAGKSI